MRTGRKLGKCAVIIAAAGRGERAGNQNGPKQYRQLGENTVLDVAISRFTDHKKVDLVLPVIHRDDLELYNSAVRSHNKLLSPVFGGPTRQASVLSGLEALAAHKPQIVLIHDAARPFVSGAAISAIFDAIGDDSGALPAHPVADTLKRRNEWGDVDETVPRDQLYCAQTPQGFDYRAILEAHRNAAIAQHEFTDDASIAEAAGLKVKIVPSPASNFKITTPEDMERAMMQVSVLMPDVRTGHGYDVHQLVAGQSITLCGVEIPHDRRLKGHSDADVGLHALTDALLATLGDGDIGAHFPPSDPTWKDADSSLFLGHAVEKVQAKGGRISHIDVTLICERPKIGPHRDHMRQRIGAICDVDPGRISVKATTNETIGFIGREEGIAALSTATVLFAPQTGGDVQ